MVVARPAWSEDVITDRDTIALGGVDPQRRHIQSGADETGPHGKGPSERDRPFGDGVVEPARDRDRDPIRWLKKGGLEIEGFAPVRAAPARVVNAHADLRTCSRFEWFEGP
jgi:hypothetical protein